MLPSSESPNSSSKPHTFKGISSFFAKNRRPSGRSMTNTSSAGDLYRNSSDPVSKSPAGNGIHEQMLSRRVSDSRMREQGAYESGQGPARTISGTTWTSSTAPSPIFTTEKRLISAASLSRKTSDASSARGSLSTVTGVPQSSNQANQSPHYTPARTYQSPNLLHNTQSHTAFSSPTSNQIAPEGDDSCPASADTESINTPHDRQSFDQKSMFSVDTDSVSVIGTDDGMTAWYDRSRSFGRTAQNTRAWINRIRDPVTRKLQPFRTFSGYLGEYGNFCLVLVYSEEGIPLAICFNDFTLPPSLFSFPRMPQELVKPTADNKKTWTLTRLQEELGELLPSAVSRALEVASLDHDRIPGNSGAVFTLVPSLSSYGDVAAEANPMAVSETGLSLSADLTEVKGSKSHNFLDALVDLDIVPSSAVVCFDVIMDIDSLPLSIALNQSVLDMADNENARMEEFLSVFGEQLKASVRATPSPARTIKNANATGHIVHSLQAATTSQLGSNGAADRPNIPLKSAIMELVQTEKSYTQKLSTLVDFHHELRSAVSPYSNAGDLGWHQVQQVFGGIEDIFRVNSAFLAELQQAVAYNAEEDLNSMAQALSKVVVKHQTSFEIYKRYISTYESRLNTYKKLYANSDRFYNSLCEFLGDRNIAVALVETMLIEPIQRIGRYQLLLREVAKHSDVAIQGDVEQAERAMRTLAKKVNAVPTQIESGEHIFLLQKVISDCPASLISGQRKLISAIPMLSFRKTTDTKKPVTLFLFSDMLLLAEGKISKDLAAHDSKRIMGGLPKRGPLTYWDMYDLEKIRIVDFSSSRRAGFDIVIPQSKSSDGNGANMSPASMMSYSQFSPPSVYGSRRGQPTLAGVPEDSENFAETGSKDEDSPLVLSFGSTLNEDTVSRFVMYVRDEQAKQMARNEQTVELFARTFGNNTRIYFFVRDKADINVMPTRQAAAILISDQNSELVMSQSVAPFVGLTVNAQRGPLGGSLGYSIKHDEPTIGDNIVQPWYTKCTSKDIVENLTLSIHNISKSLLQCYVDVGRLQRKSAILTTLTQDVARLGYVHHHVPQRSLFSENGVTRSSSTRSFRHMYRKATKMMKPQRSDHLGLAFGENGKGVALPMPRRQSETRASDLFEDDHSVDSSAWQITSAFSHDSSERVETASTISGISERMRGRRNRRASLDVLVGEGLGKVASGLDKLASTARSRTFSLAEWSPGNKKDTTESPDEILEEEPDDHDESLGPPPPPRRWSGVNVHKSVPSAESKTRPKFRKSIFNIGFITRSGGAPSAAASSHNTTRLNRAQRLASREKLAAICQQVNDELLNATEQAQKLQQGTQFMENFSLNPGANATPVRRHPPLVEEGPSESSHTLVGDTTFSTQSDTKPATDLSSTVAVLNRSLSNLAKHLEDFAEEVNESSLESQVDGLEEENSRLKKTISSLSSAIQDQHSRATEMITALAKVDHNVEPD